MKTTFPPVTWGRHPQKSPAWTKLRRAVRSWSAARKLVARGWELMFLHENETPEAAP